MKRFVLHHRVLVKAYGFGAVPLTLNPPIEGVVVRLRYADDGAWIELAERRGDILYPFPADDPRGRHVIAFPEDCDAVPR